MILQGIVCQVKLKLLNNFKHQLHIAASLLYSSGLKAEIKVVNYI